MSRRTVAYISLLLIVPVGYLIFRSQVVQNWSNIDIPVTLFAYWCSILMFWYNSDLKFYFFINKIINFFKHDYTTWLLSFRYTFIDHEEIISINSIKEFFIQSKKLIKIKDESDDYLEMLVENKYLLSLRLQQDESNNYELHFYTSKIVVPTKQNKKQSLEIAEMLESFERLLSFKISDKKIYEIDIEYNEKSPYYSYWIRKLPEEMINNFNCSINLPNRKEKITVNKNHLNIKSDMYNKLFALTNDYVSLKVI